MTASMPEHEANSHLGNYTTEQYPGGAAPVTPGRPAYGTGIVWIRQDRDGWAGEWSDDEGHVLVGPYPSTFPDILEWARSKPAPEIRIATGIVKP